VSDKDRRIAELSARVEQLERGQGFWVGTLSNALGGVISVMVVALAAALWRNPDLFRWVIVPRIVSGAAVVGGVVLTGVAVYSGVQVYRHSRGVWDERKRRLFIVISLGVILDWVLVVLLWFTVELG
jgi:hypothetical protein